MTFFLIWLTAAVVGLVIISLVVDTSVSLDDLPDMGRDHRPNT